MIYAENNIFHLRNEKISYVMMIEENGYLAHLYFGKSVKHYSGFRTYPRIDRSFSPNPPESKDRLLSLDTLLMEYPGAGFGDFRNPAHMIYHKNGTQITDFRFKDYQILKGKPGLSGLPATYVENEEEAETLLITLADTLSHVEVEMAYTIYQDREIITRSAKIVNAGENTVHIKKASSMSIDFPNRDFELLHLSGTWARERQEIREKVQAGIKIIDSKRGSSSHQQNPFVVLLDPKTDEFTGDAYGFCLVYSGNHETMVEKDPYQQTRITMGINSFDFNWPLKAQAAFQTPEVVMAYSDQGLNQLSAAYHQLFNERLIRGKYRLKERPTLINNWEATYFDFDEEKIMNIVDEAADLGIELFVLDDGWFGTRDDDYTSLGDWFEQKDKLAHGLEGLAEKVHQKSMKFGLWFEPEMISQNSQLFEKHPDWALQVPGRGKSLGRSQFVLDFSRKDVRENIYEQMTAILNRVPLDYIKWDMNRNMTEVYSSLLTAEEQGSVAHRYMLGLYAFLERLTSDYPDILFESCSGGGGRYDAGMLYYMPQTWTSDNTDAIARLKIQHGTSLVYPASSMGAHVSAIPNHQTGRKTDLAIRGNVAMSGVFGYELDLSSLTTAEKTEMKEQVAFYKKHRQLLQFGRFIRLISPYDANDAAWMFVSKDQKEAIVFYFRVLAEESYPLMNLKLAGISEEMHYRVNDHDLLYGDELMNIGMYIDPALHGDYATALYHLKAE